MSQKKGHKNEMVLSPSDAADLLRRLADQLEAGGVEIGEVVVENNGPVKIRQSIKTKADKVSFKLKLKYETALTPEINVALGELPEEEPEDEEETAREETGQPEAAEPDPGESQAAAAESPKKKPGKNKPSFKSVKSSMSKGFKLIKKALADDVMPPLAEIGQFAADCELMTTYPGKGDPRYQDFLHHVGDLKAAAEAGDVKALGRAMAEISAMRKSCHSEFK